MYNTVSFITAHVVVALFCFFLPQRRHQQPSGRLCNLNIYRPQPRFGLNVRVTSILQSCNSCCFHISSVQCLRPPFQADWSTDGEPGLSMAHVFWLGSIYENVPIMRSCRDAGMKHKDVKICALE